LRYYDQVGLLKPPQHSEAGYRLYTDEDLLILQRILALKFLGFSLSEIKVFLKSRPQRLQEVLAQQKMLLLEKQRQLTSILRTLEETEALLERNQCSWDDIVRVIQVIQMEQETTRSKMGDLIDQAYSEQARQTLRAIPFTDADQDRCNEAYAHLFSEAERLVAEGADPGGMEGQALGKLGLELLLGFTQGDPEVEAGLERLHEMIKDLPDEEKPAPPRPIEIDEFLEKAKSIYRDRHPDWSSLRPAWFLGNKSGQ